jgi:hypothetical protein
MQVQPGLHSAPASSHGGTGPQDRPSPRAADRHVRQGLLPILAGHQPNYHFLLFIVVGFFQANRRIWAPWRYWLPTPTNYHYYKTLSQLDSFVSNLIRKRWQQRTQGQIQRKQDILDRILEAVNPADWSEVRFSCNFELIFELIGTFALICFFVGTCCFCFLFLLLVCVVVVASLFLLLFMTCDANHDVSPE